MATLAQIQAVFFYDTTTLSGIMEQKNVFILIHDFCDVEEIKNFKLGMEVIFKI